MPRAKFVEELPSMLQEMQNNLHQKAHAFQQANTVKLDSKEDFYDFFAPKDEIHGGFALAHWAHDSATEEQLQKDLKVSIRCIPEKGEKEDGTCPFTGKASKARVVFAKSY